MEAIEIIAVFFAALAVGFFLDCVCRSLSHRRIRQSVRAEVQSYLRPLERL